MLLRLSLLGHFLRRGLQASSPGNTCTTLSVRCRFPRTAFGSATMTRSQTLTFLFSAFHFFIGTRWGRTSSDHLCQNESTIFEQNSTLWRGLSVWRNAPWGNLWLCPTRCRLDKDNQHRRDHLGFCQLVVHSLDFPLQVRTRYTARRT